MTEKKSIHARVTVYPRPDILDPQGKAIGEALTRLGYKQVREVRAGKSFDLVLSGVNDDKARRLLEEMGQRLLSNPIVEDFSVELHTDGEKPK